MRFLALLVLAWSAASGRADEPPRFPGVLVQTRDGLIALPLERTSYDVEVLGPVASVEVRQRWRCPLREPVDATYVGSLPPGAALTGIRLRAGERSAEGKLEPRREAWQRWRATRDGGGHALFAESAEGLIQETLSNLRPGEVVEVELRYLVELRSSSSELELTLPLVVAPRRDARGEPALPTLQGQRPRPLPDAIGWTHRAEVHVLDRGLVDPAALSSPSHALETRRGRDGVEATFRGGAQIADRDFVLRIAAPAQSVLSAETSEGATALLRWAPQAVARTEARDLLLVLDEGALRSTSLRAQAWAVVEALIARARRDDKVLVLAAGSTPIRSSASPLPPGPALHAAVERMRAVAAGSGGDLAAALRKERGSRGRARAVVLVTDGALEDVGLSSVLGGRDRLVVVALGAAPSRLEAWSRAPRTATLVAAHEDTPASVAARVDGAATVALFDPTLEWRGVTGAEVAEPLPHELLGDTTLVVAARGLHGTGTVLLHGRSPSGARVTRALELGAPSREERRAALLGGAWARRRLASLARTPGDASTAQALALAAGQASEWTSFVAVDGGGGGVASAKLVAVPLPAPYAGDLDAHARMSSDRIRPGDPEVQVEAPADARRVTLLLPTGELKPCVFDARIQRWVANFLIADDREDGIYWVRVLITRADGTRLRRVVRYQVDAAAPEVDATLAPEVTAPGAEVELVVAPRPRATALEPAPGDIGDPGFAGRVRDDVEAVIVLLPDGTLQELPRSADGRYRLRFRAPARRGTHELAITARDGARNGARLVRSLRVD